MSGPTAFVYDFLLVRGGAEQLTLHVGDTFPGVDLVLGFVNPSVFPPDMFPAHRCRALTGFSSLRGWQGLKTMAAFRRHGGFLRDYDRVIFSGVYATAGVHHRPDGPNLYYCHTPPRFAYDLRSRYLRTAPAWQVPLLRLLIPYVRREYEAAIRRMDRVIANSRTVQRRLAQYVGVDQAEVLHPAVDTRGFQWREDGGFFLSTARLEPYKRVELVIEAFKRMPDRRLVVASGGSEYHRLRTLAQDHGNINLTGWVPEDELRKLVGSCTATVYIPREEDFGISPVESMAAGKPVLGVNEGGLAETVLPGRTGLLLDPEVMESTDTAVAALIEGAEQLAAAAAGMRGPCEQRAQAFSQEVFDRKFGELLI